MSVIYLVVKQLRSPVEQLFWVFIKFAPRNTTIKIVTWTQHREHHQHVKLRQRNTGHLYLITLEMFTPSFHIILRIPVKQTICRIFNHASVYQFKHVCNYIISIMPLSEKTSMCGTFKYLKRIQSCRILVSLLLHNQNINILLELSHSKSTIVAY